MRTDFEIFLGPPLVAQLRFDNSHEIKYRLGADTQCVVYPGRQVGAEAMESDDGLLTIVNWSGFRGIHWRFEPYFPPIMATNKARVQYHRILGSGMQLNLTAVQVLVTTESSILSESPRVDILLLRREGDTWNEAQRARLPDGVCDSAAAHVLLEFKYTESVTEDGLLQAAAYNLFYRQVQELPKEQTLPVVLSAKTPQRSRLAKWGYEESERGVFRSNLPLVGRVVLLVLNRLPASANNAFVKLLASRKQERDSGLAALARSGIAESTDFHAYILGLTQTLDVKGETGMAEVLTPEKVLAYGKRMRELVFETGTPEERLAGLSPDEILAGLSLEERRKLLHLLQKEIDAGAEGGTDRARTDRGEN